MARKRASPVHSISDENPASTGVGLSKTSTEMETSPTHCAGSVATTVTMPSLGPDASSATPLEVPSGAVNKSNAGASHWYVGAPLGEVLFTLNKIPVPEQKLLSELLSNAGSGLSKTTSSKLNGDVHVKALPSPVSNSEKAVKGKVTSPEAFGSKSAQLTAQLANPVESANATVPEFSRPKIPEIDPIQGVPEHNALSLVKLAAGLGCTTTWSSKVTSLVHRESSKIPCQETVITFGDAVQGASGTSSPSTLWPKPVASSVTPKIVPSSACTIHVMLKSFREKSLSTNGSSLRPNSTTSPEQMLVADQSILDGNSGNSQTSNVSDVAAVQPSLSVTKRPITPSSVAKPAFRSRVASPADAGIKSNALGSSTTVQP